MVPATRHKHHLTRLLHDLQWWAGVWAGVMERRGGHVIGQVSATISQGFFLPWWEEDPLFPPTDVDRPAKGAEDVSVEW